jgi:hypothetical protein
MNKAIITPAEADVFLALEEDWLVLDNATKVAHIERASVYVQTQWVCAFDWDDTPNIPEVVKEAVAWYAYSEFKGVLYGSSDASTFDVVEKSVKAGSVTVSKKFNAAGGKYGPASQLGYPDALMKSECSRVSSVSELIRD